MSKKHAVRLVLFVAVICFSLSAWSQDETEDVDETEELDETEDLGDMEVSEEEIDLEEELDLEEEEEKDFSSESVDLDLSALGEIDPEKELAQVETQTDTSGGKSEKDWSERTMDILELHGYFRVRPELYHNFHIRGDNSVYDRTMVRKMPDDPGNDCRNSGGSRRPCKNSTLAGANMRFRLEPTINISEEVWIKAQFDFLDNVMLGSTPRYWQSFEPYNAAGGPPSEMTEIGRVQGWDMGPPASEDMVVVRRVWGEVLTPFGQLRFGRMGDDWGLGLLHNSGNGLNDDHGNSVDRIMFAFKINDWIIAPAFDFPNSGVSAADAAGRPFEVGQLDDAYQLVGIFGYKHDKEEQKAMIKRGDWVVNTGLYFSYRWQVLSFQEAIITTDGTDPNAAPEYEYRFYRRDTWNITPDFWFQFLMGTFHLELELAFVYGNVGNADGDQPDFDMAHSLELIQFGGLIQMDYGLLSDQLRIGLEFGYASGDGDSEGMRAPATYDQFNDSSNDVYSVFSFNPAYTTDLILYRHILGSISQSYYFKAWVRYDFLKNAMGRNLGLEADVIYSRAADADSTINNSSANLGVEIDIKMMFVTQDHFHAGLAYGVLFPLSAFKGTPYGGVDNWNEELWGEYPYTTDNDLSIPQTIQVFLGISY